MAGGPIYCTRDPEEVAHAFKERLLRLADKQLSQSTLTRHNMRSPIGTAAEARARVTISEEYAEQARLDWLSRLIKVEDMHMANAISSGKMSAPA